MPHNRASLIWGQWEASDSVWNNFSFCFVFVFEQSWVSDSVRTRQQLGHSTPPSAQPIPLLFSLHPCKLAAPLQVTLVSNSLLASPPGGLWTKSPVEGFWVSRGNVCLEKHNYGLGRWLSSLSAGWSCCPGLSADPRHLDP